MIKAGLNNRIHFCYMEVSMVIVQMVSAQFFVFHEAKVRKIFNLYTYPGNNLPFHSCKSPHSTSSPSSFNNVHIVPARNRITWS